MADILCSQFQESVGDYLIRHKSILDCITKFQESSARLNRAVAKSVTNCGCVSVIAERHAIPEGTSLVQLRELLDSDVRGRICDNCRDTLETEVGSTLFYLTALLNAMDLSLYDCLLKEHQRIKTLGVFNIS